MKTWTVHVDRLNPTRLPIVVEGIDRTYYRDRRSWFVKADDEAGAIAAAVRSGERARRARERAA